ncbi:MAG: hypothetical protein V3U24_03410 [Candidatus Neomarinimicrobiota bacterium]
MMAKPLSRRKRRSKKQREFINSLLFFVVSLLSISGLLTYLWVYNEINITERESSALEKIRTNLAAQNVDLRSQIAGLMRVDRITEIAESKLNMVTPEPETLVVFIDYAVKVKTKKK